MMLLFARYKCLYNNSSMEINIKAYSKYKRVNEYNL